MELLLLGCDLKIGAKKRWATVAPLFSIILCLNPTVCKSYSVVEYVYRMHSVVVYLYKMFNTVECTRCAVWYRAQDELTAVNSTNNMQ